METSKLVSIARRQDADADKITPNNLARLVLEHHQIMSDNSGALYTYTGSYWERISIHAIRSYAAKYDSEKHTSNRRRDEVAGFIRSTQFKREVQWRNLGAAEIPFQNGVLDLVTGELRPHRAEDNLETTLPHPWGDPVECPTWLNALTTYWGDDADFGAKVDALQEFFGYCLMPHARFKKALVCVGESDTGKSQIAHVIRLMVGHQNCSSVSVEDMDDARKRVPLVGKMVNMLTELTSKAVIADGGFKTLISTEESVQMDPKYCDAYSYTPIAKHLIICNDLPTINDRSRGTYNRLLMVRFNRVLSADAQDRDFQSKLSAEIQGICQWAVVGAQRLHRNGGMFTAVPESDSAVREYRESQNDIYDFINDKCEIDKDGSVPFSEMFEKFLLWVKTGKATRHSLGRMLKAAGYAVKDEWDGYSKRSRKCVQGLRWQVGA